LTKKEMGRDKARVWFFQHCADEQGGGGLVHDTSRGPKTIMTRWEKGGEKG